MSAEKIKARILTVMRNLPPLPMVTRQLLTVMRDEESSAEDVAKVLSSDGMLAGKVLKLVNSSFYGVTTEVTTISRAVVILGFSGIRNLALGFGTVEALAGMGTKSDMTAYWSHPMATAAAAQALAPFVNRRTDPEEAFIAGLMHDIGGYVLAASVPEFYGEISRLPAHERLRRELEETGFTHPQIGQGLLKFWELPESFTNSARFHHDVDVATCGEQPLTTLVALADILACIHGGEFETGASENDLSRLRRAAGLKPNNFWSALETMDQKISEMSEFMKISGAGSNSNQIENEIPAMTCVVVTTDESRQELVCGLLKHLGHKIFPMESYFNQESGCNEVGMVLVDPQALSKDQLDRLAIYLEQQNSARCVLVEEGNSIPESMKSWPATNFIFGGRQLAKILQLQLA